MKYIKKVAVSPVPRNQGAIIDSLNTSDDATKNAPSIRAVNEALGNKANSTDVYNKTQSDAKYQLQGNFAIISGTATIPASTEDSSGDYIDYGGISVNLDYPTGFNNDNSIVLTIETGLQSGTSGTTGNQPYLPGFPMGGDQGLGRGKVKSYTWKNNNGLHLQLQNGEYPNPLNVKYKVVLMKVS